MRPDDNTDLATSLIRHIGCRQRQCRWQGAIRAAFVGGAALATMAATTTERIAPLAAVGRLDFAGQDGSVHCTATLIAPMLAITAAHCMERPATAENTEFRPAFSALRGTEFLRLTGWTAAAGERDIAMLCLSTRAVTEPMPRGANGPSLGEGLTVVGYAIPADSGQTHDSCTVDELRNDGTFVLNCPLRPGTSGAPVLRHTTRGREIVGVISATSNRQSLAWDVSGDVALPDCQ